MPATPKGLVSEKLACLRLPVIIMSGLLCIGAASDDGYAPTIQDLRVAGRVLTFQETRPAGALTVAIPYAPGNSASYGEADAIASILGNGLPVGSLILRPLVLPLNRLAATEHIDAVLATAGLDYADLKAALMARRIPCLTMHPAQVAQGPCVVSIRSAPSVSIVFSIANAAAFGIHFATAFRMMVTEL